ncbi:hypothetical protein ACWGB8_07945 [Kitasatospora sp. NPDC054939]
MTSQQLRAEPANARTAALAEAAALLRYKAGWLADCTDPGAEAAEILLALTDPNPADPAAPADHRALAFNAASHTLARAGYFVPISIRRQLADAVLAAVTSQQAPAV